MKTKLILLSAFFLVTALAFTFTASAAIPHLMNFQGKAMDRSGTPLNGTYNLTFRMYNSETGGTAKWSETQTNILITNGIFQVQLGSATPLNLPFDEPYWISLEINADREMSPRTKLASVPYAYRAESLADTPVIPFYKKGFDIEYADFNSIKIAPGVMDVSGKMFTTTTYSSPLQLAYLDNPQNRDWAHGQKTNDSNAYVYAYNNNGQIAFKFSDELPDLSDHLGNIIKKPFLYQRYPDTPDGIYYRYIGNLTINTAGAISAMISQGRIEPASIFSVFGGDGTGGDVVVSSDTNFSTIDDPNRPGIAQFRNLTINSGQTLTIDTGYAHIGVSGTVTIHGTITALGKGAAGGAPSGGYGQNAENILPNAGAAEVSWKIENCVTGAGGSGGGAGGGAGDWGGLGSNQNATATATSKILKLTGGLGDNSTHSVLFNPDILYYGLGAGGGAGITAYGYSGGQGGHGGGCIYIECGELIFDGVLNANAEDGGISGHWLYASGGAGGGGGMIFVRAKTLTTNSGTVTVAAGVGGTGTSTGGSGAAGFKDIVQVP